MIATPDLSYPVEYQIAAAGDRRRPLLLCAYGQPGKLLSDRISSAEYERINSFFLLELGRRLCFVLLFSLFFYGVLWFDRLLLRPPLETDGNLSFAEGVLKSSQKKIEYFLLLFPVGQITGRI